MGGPRGAVRHQGGNDRVGGRESSGVGGNDGAALDEAEGGEWDKQELIRLMEAAVATPDQWDVVAKKVGSGRSPVACMHRFLNLAVEETLAEHGREEEEAVSVMPPPLRKTPAVPEKSATATAGGNTLSSDGITPPSELAAAVAAAAAAAAAEAVAAASSEEGGSAEDGSASAVVVSSDSQYPSASPSTGGVASEKHPGNMTPSSHTTSAAIAATDGGASINPVVKKNIGSGGSGGGISPARKAGAAQKHGKSRNIRGKSLPIHRGPSSPALVLATSLISNVHPEVLSAAMAAAAAATDVIARRSTAAGDLPSASGSTSQGQNKRPFSLAHGSVCGYGYGDEDDDVEMQDYAGSAAAAVARGGGSGGGGHASTKRLELNGRWSGEGAIGERYLPSPLPTREPNQRGGRMGDENDGALELDREATASSAARAALLSVAGLQARNLAEVEDRRTESLVSDLLEAR